MATPIPTTKLVIIGAGLAGATFSHLATQHHIPTTIIEKSRGTGGRAGSKRLSCGGIDQGASILGFSDEDLTDIREHLLEQNVLQRWQSGYVGTPRMSSITRYLSSHAELVTETKVQHIERSYDDYWLLRDDKYQPVIKAEYVMIATPALQASMLLATIPNTSTLLLQANRAGANTLSQWVMWLRTSQTDAAPLQFSVHPSLETLIKDSDKPGRERQDDDLWVVQASPEWSQTHLDSDKAEVQAALQQAFSEVIDCEVYEAGEPHRWLLGRQAMPVSSSSFLWDNQLNIGLIGDWLCQGDAEGAMLSAQYAFDYLRKKVL
ncbi:NAD(P)/FAD-dependent oxidoreductase [Marinomonas ostreistagni]|uniref:NAD(P)/FAD-dependent oxidoreductase n=1 Tax=Marinomonas ostreistagni TaxID=359209 RepID=UPI00194E9400|nr:NAD(P)-binding protein [Marinomonas ostreistagni]MBM6551315.1 NAD(P)-binding protein [Marinomonas ostreistagni]